MTIFSDHGELSWCFNVKCGCVLERKRLFLIFMSFALWFSGLLSLSRGFASQCFTSSTKNDDNNRDVFLFAFAGRIHRVSNLDSSDKCSTLQTGTYRQPIPCSPVPCGASNCPLHRSPWVYLMDSHSLAFPCKASLSTIVLSLALHCTASSVCCAISWLTPAVGHQTRA